MSFYEETSPNAFEANQDSHSTISLIVDRSVYEPKAQSSDSESHSGKNPLCTIINVQEILCVDCIERLRGDIHERAWNGAPCEPIAVVVTLTHRIASAEIECLSQTLVKCPMVTQNYAFSACCIGLLWSLWLLSTLLLLLSFQSDQRGVLLEPACSSCARSSLVDQHYCPMVVITYIAPYLSVRPVERLGHVARSYIKTLAVFPI